MNKKSFALLLAVIGLMVFSSDPGFSQIVPKITDMPESLPVPQRQELSTQRDHLIKVRNEIREKTDSHNRQCMNVEENSTVAATCAVEQALLKERIIAYGEDVKQYNERVKNALVNDPGKRTPYTVGVSAIRGEVTIENRDGSRLTSANLAHGRVIRIDIGTRVTTGSTGRLQILLLDETVFTIGPNSDMIIDEFVYDPDLSPKKIAVSFNKGIFRWVTGKVARKDPATMRVKLPVATIGIRGTDFETIVEANGACTVRLYSGMLEITPRKGGARFLLKENRMVTFKADGTFTRTEPIKHDNKEQ